MDEKAPLMSSGYGGPSYGGESYTTKGAYPPSGGAAGQYPPPAGAVGPYPPQGGVVGPYPPQGGAAGSYPPQGGAAGPYPPQGGATGQYPPQGGPVPQQGAHPGGPSDAEGHDNEPSAPPADSMDQLPGYSNIGFEGASLPPPSYDEAIKGPPPTRESITTTSTISEQDARDAIIQHVSEHCCYGKGPARDMQFTNMVSSNAFHYTLETFAEGRSTKWTSQPYRGEGLIVTGPPPGPWDIQAQPPQMFKSSTLEMEVPNTASVKTCYTCTGRGFKTCYSCFGSGRSRCNFCSGSGSRQEFIDGRYQYRPCSFCQGGWNMCYVCSGSGQRMCQKCQGRGNLRWFILLTIKWTNHLDDHIVERTALESSLVRKVGGKVAFEETNTRVWPVNHFPEQEINVASNNLVSKHGSQFPSERILMQRHRIRIVPVTQVSYHYKDKISDFFVYGIENKVYAPDYPAKCCCGCSII